MNKNFIQSLVPLCSRLTSHSKQGLVVVRFIVISPGTDKVPTLPSDSIYVIAKQCSEAVWCLANIDGLCDMFTVVQSC